jgi:adenylyl-sulfate kinase
MIDKNISWQSGKVSYNERCRLMGQKGLAVWFTGLSGAGKSTIAIEVERLLYERNIKAYLLDGDNMRHGINSDLGFSDADRDENIRRVSEIAKLFCDAGFITLVSFISPFFIMRENAKRLIGAQRFIEVYVKADIEVCMKRDPKGLYRKNINQFTGIDSAYQPPINPDIVLDTERLSADEAAEFTVKAINEKLESEKNDEIYA